MADLAASLLKHYAHIVNVLFLVSKVILLQCLTSTQISTLCQIT